MSTLHIRLPSKAAAYSAPNWLELACPFALAGSTIEREGSSSLSALSDLMTKAQSVVVLLAACDVTLLRMAVPPLSAARLKAALPNLVEDKILVDPASCALVAGTLSEGLRTIAVVERAWLELLSKTLSELGARRIRLLPAQLCLPLEVDQLDQFSQAGRVSAAIGELDEETNITLRLSEHGGGGFAINVLAGETVPHAVIQSLCAVVPKASVTMYVPQSAVRTYHEIVSSTAGLDKRINIVADNWSRWISGAHASPLDLLAGTGAKAAHTLNWRQWRWPMALLTALLLVNVIALNIDWWSMKNEARTLRATMTQIYKATYPNESVIIDPIVQMQQKISIAKRNAGEAAPDDFTALAASFGEAWAGAMPGKSAMIAGLEYREHGLLVRFKHSVGSVEGNEIQAAAPHINNLLATQKLSIESVPGASSAMTWQIRRAK